MSTVTEQDYKSVGGVEYGSGYAFRIQIRGIDRDLTKDEQHAIYSASDIIADALLKGNTGADPKTHEKAKLSKLEILSCFGPNVPLR